jgi:toxin-antitoxin system PIN domain toxin
VVGGDARFGISPLALGAVIRITTQPRAFNQPSSLAEAFAYCNNLLRQPHCEVVEPGERHWDILERLSRQAQITGARITDAWFAALAIEHGCTWITYDRDYARFSGLDWRLP